MADNNTMQVSIYLPKELYTKVKDKADKRLLSINKWIVNRLEQDVKPRKR